MKNNGCFFIFLLSMFSTFVIQGSFMGSFEYHSNDEYRFKISDEYEDLIVNTIVKYFEESGSISSNKIRREMLRNFPNIESELNSNIEKTGKFSAISSASVSKIWNKLEKKLEKKEEQQPKEYVFLPEPKEVTSQADVDRVKALLKKLEDRKKFKSV